MVAVRAIAGDVVLSGEFRDLAHFFYGVVVVEIEVGDAVARRRRHGFLASGAALALRSVLVRPLSVRTHPAAASCVLRLCSGCYSFFFFEAHSASVLANSSASEQ